MEAKQHLRAKPCTICLSPVREEIELLLNQHVSQMDIATRFTKQFNCGVGTLRAKISRHKSKHLGMFENPEHHDSDKSLQVDTSLDALAESLLKIGSKIISEQPEKVNLRDVVALQKLLLDRQKINATNDAMKLAMAKFFGGFMNGPNSPGD